VVDLGLIDYGPACDLQHRLVEARKARAIPDVLLLCEHPHVITMGRNGHAEHLRASNRLLEQMNVELHGSDRGGDVTYHGPGQIVAYPIFDLAEHTRDVRWYVDRLEEVMIRTTADFGIDVRRICGQHGAWIQTAAGDEKIGALGVHISRWVTSHGLAYNVSTDLEKFGLIVPCGIADKKVTSLEALLGRKIAMSHAIDRMTVHFGEVFDLRLEKIKPERLTEALESPRETTAGATASLV
jgi:lipoyl(octanoyl) transferase